jgi:hypothetical protein
LISNPNDNHLQIQMSGPATIDHQAAQRFLQTFPRPIRERGDAYFRNGAVKSLRCVDPAGQWVASVQGTELYNVALGYHPELREWQAECSCPVGDLCKHAYASMFTLLMQHSDDDPAPIASEGGDTQTPSLAAALQSAVGRWLNVDEHNFTTAVADVFRRSASSGKLRPDQWWRLNWRPPNPDDAVQVAPRGTKSELEFWHFLAAYAEAIGLPVPEFMGPLPVPPEVHERVRAIRRREEVSRWKQVLAGIAEEDPGPVALEPLELRVRLGEDRGIIETRSGEGAWRELRSGRFQYFQGSETGRLDNEARLLWNSLETLHENFVYADPNATTVFSHFLKLPGFRRLFVAGDGTPLVFHEAPLRWDVQPPEADDGDYLVALRQADGSPAPATRFIVPGETPLHVTDFGIFPGPPPVDFGTNGAEARIPAEAFETGRGMTLLKRMRTEAPARLAAKVRTVTLRPLLRAELKQDSFGRGSEYCHVTVQAAAPDGSHAMCLIDREWEEAETNGSRRSDLVHVDRSALAPFPGVLEAAGFRSLGFDGVNQLRVTKKFPEHFVEFLKNLPPDVAVELSGELATFQNAKVSGQIRLDATEAGIDWFDLQVVVDVNDTTLTKAEIKLLLNAKGGWVRLDKKGWRRLEYKLSQEEDADLARLGLTPHELAGEPQRLHALQLADKAARHFLPADTCDRIERRAAELKARVVPPQPSTVSATLRPYQLEGFHFLAYLAANHFGGILADDMGLGKTVQTLTWLIWLREEGAAAAARSLPSLVVCPKSVQDNWRAEVQRFCPGLVVRVWSGDGVKNLPALLDSAALHVVNYAQLRSIGDALARTDLLAVILDEGQNIKNPTSQTAMIARRLRAGHRLILSGTPIENRLLDLWSLMAFAMPGALGSRTEFARLYDAKSDPFARQRLAARVRPFLLRRTKAQVAADLPDRVEEDLSCAMEGEQKTLYRAELKRAQQMLLKLQTQEALNQERFNVLTSLLRLRQICCHPKLVKPDAKSTGAKLEALLETLEPLIEEGEKVLVFSQFVEALELLREAVAARDWKTWFLIGSTENRGALVEDFQNHEGPGVFFISLKAGGAGLNLTAASYVVLFDPWWNPAVENQAIDRTHRIGQARKVIAYRLLIKDSIEEKIRALQKQKGALAQDILGEEKFAQALTLDDLRHLLAG